MSNEHEPKDWITGKIGLYVIIFMLLGLVVPAITTWVISGFKMP